MNEIYLVIMGVMIVITIFLWCFVDPISDSFIGLFGITILSIASTFMFLVSGLINIGDDLIEIKPATNTRVGVQLVIQSVGYPTQIISDIALIDKKVQVKRVTTQNAWGGRLETNYIVEPIN